MDSQVEIRPGRRIHLLIDETTAGQPTAFCIHGLGGSGRQWREQLLLLKQRYRLVIPDLLGHGESEKPYVANHNPYTFVEHSQDLQALFEKYAGAENIILGHSYGGALAASLALRNQSRTHKLILFAPMRCKPIAAIPAIYRLPVWVLELLRPYLEKNFRAGAFVSTDSPRLVTEEDKAGKNNSLYVIKSMLQGMQDCPALDVAKLGVPTSIIAGEKDGITPVTSMKNFYAALPRVQFEILANAAHMIMLEQPQKVNVLLQNFLR